MTALLIFIILSLTVVSAADDNQTDSINLEINANLDGDSIKKPKDTGSFNELSSDINNCQGNELVLTKDYTYKTGEGLEDGINIQKDHFTIDGQGHTIDAAGQAKIFMIRSNNVTLKNIIFKNGHSSNGGALYFRGNGTVDNCYFINNSADHIAGAIYFTKEGIVLNSHFNENTAVDMGGALVFDGSGKVTQTTFLNNNGSTGGGIYFSKNGIVENCDFNYNYARTNGGGLFGENLTIIESMFNSNTANCGGACYIYNKTKIIDSSFKFNHGLKGGAIFSISNISIDKCTFNDCDAEIGGAIYGENGDVNNCNFTDNSAKQGGALSFSNQINVSGSNFNNNRASGNGGAIYCNYIMINKCGLIRNSAENGGGLYLNSGGLIDNLKFIYNSAKIGGAIFLSGGDLSIENSNFEFNNADDNSCNIYLSDTSSIQTNNVTPANLIPTNFKTLEYEISHCSGSILTLTKDYRYNQQTDGVGLTINKNNFIIDGQGHIIDGAYLKGIRSIGKGVTLKNIKFINLYESTYPSIDFNDGNVFNCTFINMKGNKGGALHVHTYALVENCKFINCSATYGGAAYFENEGKVINCTYENVTQSEGDEVYYEVGTFYELNELINKAGNELILTKDYRCNNNYGEINITKSNFVIDGRGHTIAMDYYNPTVIFSITGKNVILKNISFYKGKIAVIFKEFGKVENCDFGYCDCYSDGDIRYGSAITFEKNGIVNNSCFHNGFSYYNGGAIYFRGDGTVENSRFIENHAKNGGAIYFECKGTVTNCTFIKDEANYGGALYFLKDNAIITNCYFEDVEGHPKGYGAIIYFENRGEALMRNCTIIHANLGKDLLDFRQKATLENCIFRNCDGGNEGTICFRSEGKLENCSFEYIDGTDIGAINFYGKGEVINCNFSHSNTLYSGGVMQFFSTGIVRNCNFNDNFAEREHGGAILFHSEGIVENSNFTNNNALYKGGAICFLSNGTVNNCIFKNNKATSDNGNPYYPEDYSYGGAIMFNTDGRVTNSIFIGNSAVHLGGAIYCKGHVLVENATFIDNHVRDDAGAIKFEKNAIVKNCNFTNNTAGNEGGAIIFNEISSIDGTYLIENLAAYGGAISTYNDLNISNTVFKGNNATMGPPHITLNGNITLTLNNVTPKDLRPFKRINLKLSYKNKITYGDSQIITIEVTCDGNKMNNGTLYLKLNNDEYSLNIENGIATKEFPILISGTYIGNVTYYGGIDYPNPTENIKFEVKKAPTNLQVDVANVTHMESLKIHVNVTSNGKSVNEGNVSIKINNKTYVEDVVNGSATLEIQDLDVAIYDANVTYDGGNNYVNAMQPVKFKIAIENATIDLGAVINCTYGGNVIIQVIVIGANRTVHEGTAFIKIGDEIYAKNITTGIARFTIPNLDAGTYTGIITFDGGINFNTPTLGVTFSVAKKVVSLEINVLDVYYGDNVKINVNVTAYGKAINEGKVIANINNVEHIANVENGTATIEIENLDVGPYSAIMSYDGGNNYNNQPKIFNFNVLKLNAAIAALDKSYVINYGGIYSITLKDMNGNTLSGQTVTFTLDGKNIGSATTNANGIATISFTANILKTLKSGTKKLVIQFTKDCYNPAVKTVKITINKEKTKIVAKKKTFKKSLKVKKYAVTLKNSKGKAIKKVQLTLKVKGKTYKAKTNVKGKATFKIKKLTKKGTFNAKITFKGNAYYNKITKNVKIKIR